MEIAGIQNVVPIWNDFFFPLVFIQNDNLKTLPQGLTTFMGEYTTDWGVLFAGLTLSAAPISSQELGTITFPNSGNAAAQAPTAMATGVAGRCSASWNFFPAPGTVRVRHS